MSEQLKKQLAGLTPEKRKLLEQMLRERAQGKGQASTATIARRDSSGPSPLSFPQRRLWFLHQLEPDIHAYTIAQLFSFSGRLDVDALQAGLNRIIERHDSLHSSFPAEKGEPVRLRDPRPRIAF